MKNTLVILGYSDFGISTLSEAANESLDMTDFHIVMNVKKPDKVRPYEWPGFTFRYFNDKDFCFIQNEQKMHFGVFDAHIKYQLFHWFKKKFSISEEWYISIKHPISYFSRSSDSGNGLFLEPMSVVSTFSKIGFGVTIKRGSLIGHHVSIGDFTTINPGARIAGSVSIGEGATIGIGATINNHVTIGQGSVIGAGSVVTKDIPEGVIAFGNPCKVIKDNERWINSVKTVENFIL